MTRQMTQQMTQPGMATLFINGEPHAYMPQSVAELLAGLGLDTNKRGIAVALNSQVLPRAAWAQTKVMPGDKIEIVRPLAGG